MLFNNSKMVTIVQPIRKKPAISSSECSTIWKEMLPEPQDTIRATPNPMSVLKSGPAKQAVTAVCDMPSFAMAGFA